MTFTGTCLLTTRMQLCVCTSGTVQDGVQTFQASASSRDLPATTAAVSRSATPTMVDDGIPAWRHRPPGRRQGVTDVNLRKHSESRLNKEDYLETVRYGSCKRTVGDWRRQRTGPGIDVRAYDSRRRRKSSTSTETATARPFVVCFVAGMTSSFGWTCVKTESHQLYGVLIARLSSCIFEWDEHDYDKLWRAKAAQLQLSTTEARRCLTRDELALHWRRRTWPTPDTVRLINALIHSLSDDAGRDTGVELFDMDVITQIWAEEQKHVQCLQDPDPDIVKLYTETGSLTKVGVRLKIYRCCRGTVSLESFHRHLATFIPGKQLHVLRSVYSLPLLTLK